MFPAMKKSTLVLSILNLLGAVCLAVFVFGARDLAVTEGRDSYDFGDSAGFLLLVVPALVLCLVADVVWLVVAVVALVKRRGTESAIACVIVLTVWTVVLAAARGWAQLPSIPAAQALAPGQRVP